MQQLCKNRISINLKIVLNIFLKATLATLLIETQEIDFYLRFPSRICPETYRNNLLLYVT